MHKRKFLGIPLNAWSETFLLLGLLLVLNWALGDGKRWVHSALHPFWAVVLLISAQYGTLAGLMSAAVSTFFLYVGNVPPQTLKESFFDYQFRLAILPALWVIVGFILGEIRSRLEDQNHKLEAEIAETRDQADVVVSGYEKLKASKEYQELSIASQKQSAAALYQSFKYLAALNPAHILRDLDKIIVTALNPKKFSVFAWGPNGFEAATCFGWTPEDHYLSRIPVGHPLYVEVADKHRLVCSVNQNDEKTLDGQGLIAAPLIDTDTREIFGLVKIEAVHSLEFTLPTLKIFQVLCELIGSSYSHARKYKKLVQQALYGRQAGVFSQTSYQLQKQLWSNVIAKSQLPVAEITLTAQTTATHAHAKEQEDAALAQILTTQVPQPGQVFEAGNAPLQYQILLPGSSSAEAEQLAAKCLQAIASSDTLRMITCTQKISSLQPATQANSPATRVVTQESSR